MSVDVDQAAIDKAIADLEQALETFETRVGEALYQLKLKRRMFGTTGREGTLAEVSGNGTKASAREPIGTGFTTHERAAAEHCARFSCQVPRHRHSHEDHEFIEP